MPNSRKKNSSRQLKVSELLKRRLAEILVSYSFRVDEKNIFTITISEVNVTPDLKIAHIFFTPFWQKKNKITPEETLIKLVYENSNNIKKKLSNNIDLRFTPKLIFKLDKLIHETSKIEELLKSPKVAQDL